VDLAGESWALLALRILIVFALADISLRYVELPVRRGVLSYWVKGLKYRTPAEKKRQKIQLSAIAALLAISISVITVRAISIGNDERAKIVQDIQAGAISTPTAPVGIWLTGDSVILGIRNELAKNHEIGLVNARVGRQAPELLNEIERDLKTSPDGAVVLNLGNNNVLREDDVVAILDALAEKDEVILVNTAVPRPWRDGNNEIIRTVAARYANVTVVDWAKASEGRPEYFAPDGVHLVPTGVAVYVAEISRYLD
jgi:hypothetical protein